jgi:hypothetical protein
LIDDVFRGTAPGEGGAASEASTWDRLVGLLNTFNSDLQKAESPTWNDTIGAGGPVLRAWDRKVRVAAPWLCCFNAELTNRDARDTTPAEWLQSSMRRIWFAGMPPGRRDYWGGGDEGQAAEQSFFAEAARRCDKELPLLGAEYRLRYDWPGSGGAIALEAAQKDALDALQEWRPLKLQTRFSAPTAESKTSPFRLEIEPFAGPPLELPPGTAALALPSAATADGVRFGFDAAGKETLTDIEITSARGESLRRQAYAIRSSEARGAAADANARCGTAGTSAACRWARVLPANSSRQPSRSPNTPFPPLRSAARMLCGVPCCLSSTARRACGPPTNVSSKPSKRCKRCCAI